MANQKLGVEVISAHELGPSCTCPYLELHFCGQMFRTTIKEDVELPRWNESFFFDVLDPANVANLALEAYVYNKNKTTNSNSFVGKVRLAGTYFVPAAEAVATLYPLEKRGMFSRAKGKLVLKVFLTDDPSMDASNNLEASETTSNNRSQSQADDSIRRYLEPPPQQRRVEYAVKEISPFLGGGGVVNGRFEHAEKATKSHDLVEHMQYLFVSVVKGRDLPDMHAAGGLDPYVEVNFGNYKGVTKHFQNEQSPEWNAVFAFSNDYMQTSRLQVIVKNKDRVRDDFVGMVCFDLSKVPTRVPPDSALTPEWYGLVDDRRESITGELMIAVWKGTQMDEAFRDAWHSDAATPVHPSPVSSRIRSKVYYDPVMWYVRVSITRADDLVRADRTNSLAVYVKAQIGNQVSKTKSVQAQTCNPSWNEELMFVAAEPFEDDLSISVEGRAGPNVREVIGHVRIPLSSIEKRTDYRPILFRWFHLEKPVARNVVQLDEKLHTRVLLGLCLEGGYHVLDNSTSWSGDFRPTAKQLCSPPNGLLELGILRAEGLLPMKTLHGRGVVDPYCVAKYGRMWVRTRTILNSFSPRFNEQCAWEVHDPSTVLIIGIFDNCQLGENSSKGCRDVRIGRVRIRLSTLETGRIYAHAYPILVLAPTGIKKMGELHLAIRFTSTSLVNMLYMYSRPLLPKMHYISPLSVIQADLFRYQAVNIVAARLSRMEPPLRKEVVEYMCDVDSHMWSMRRSKAIFYRFMSVLSRFITFGKWFDDVCAWKNPVMTLLVHAVFVALVFFQDLILPAIFSCTFLLVLWRHQHRPSRPAHVDAVISHAEAVHPDELDEEFDTFPTSRSTDVVRMRYDRLRAVAGRFQTLAGDLVAHGERIEALLSWRDPRATAIFGLFCFVAAIAFCVIPHQVLATVAGFYIMRHPRFRQGMPSVLENFFMRLPAKTDSMM